MTALNKDVLKPALLQDLDDEIAAAVVAAQQAQAAAAHEDNQPENQYDTLSLEAAYLAHGQSERILALQQERIRLAQWAVPSFHEYDEVALGALVQLVHPQLGERWVWLTRFGGRRLAVAGVDVTLLSLQAPLAQRLLQRGVGDDVNWQDSSGWVIESLS
jgi:transcription elongation GreA/GreB family factor